MPEITHEDNPVAVMREMTAFFQVEVSNHERIIKAKDKMQAKIDQGYYPGVPHYGYKKSELKSLHIRDEPKFSLLQQAMRGMCAGKYDIHDALKFLQSSGLRLDLNKFRRILKEPYYCGIIQMGSFKSFDGGLHEAMITRD